MSTREPTAGEGVCRLDANELSAVESASRACGASGSRAVSGVILIVAIAIDPAQQSSNVWPPEQLVTAPKDESAARGTEASLDRDRSGPAGLRTAATAADRGHAVKVHERASMPGGRLRDMAWLPTRDRWSWAVDDLVELSSAPAESCSSAASRRATN